MPKRRTEDAVHVVMTDHRIRRHPPTGDRMAAKSERHGVFSGPVRLAHPTVLDPLPETRAYLAIAIRAMPSPPAAFLFELGRLEPQRAEESFRRALAVDPRHDGARLALAEWLIARKRPTEAAALIAAAAELDVALLNAHAVSSFSRTTGRSAENPESSQARRFLGPAHTLQPRRCQACQRETATARHANSNALSISNQTSSAPARG